MSDLFDGEMQAPVKRMLERDIQAHSIRYARSKGWWCRKFASPANRSVPDYILGRDGCTLFVEFKRPGGVVTDAQKEEHKAMQAVGLAVHIVTSVEEFKALLARVETEMGVLQAANWL